MNMMQAVPEGVIGIVGLEMARGAKSQNAVAINRLSKMFTENVTALQMGIASLGTMDPADRIEAIAWFKRQLIIDGAVYEYLIDQLADESIRIS
jgi:hypothetical protein